jgi:hypothetical protein
MKSFETSEIDGCAGIYNPWFIMFERRPASEWPLNGVRPKDIRLI